MSEENRRAPAFQFYADDFLAGTMEMSQAEVGAYIRLLCHQWNRGSIPVEAEKQQRLAGGSVSVDVLAKFPADESGLLKNKRMESERQKQAAYREQQRKKGLISAEVRKGVNRCTNHGTNHGSTGVPTEAQPDTQPNTQPEGNSPSPSPNKYKEASKWHLALGLELPENLQTDNCLSALNDWLAYKKERRTAYKTVGLKTLLAKLSREFTAAELPMAIERSISNNWQGIFKQDNGNAQAGSNTPSKHPPGQEWRDDPNDWRHSL